MSVAHLDPKSPRLARPVSLRFKADWGQGNLTRVAGWLAQEVGDRAPAGSEFSIHAGRASTDAVEALKSGAVDIAIVTPGLIARLFMDGTTPLGRQPEPWLRALGSITHRDRLVVVADASLPVTTVPELAQIGDQLVIATSQDDGVNAVGMIAHEALRSAGVDPIGLVDRGARFIYDERPFLPIEAFASGEANVLIHEAIMTPPWQRIADRRPIRYLQWGDEAIHRFADLGWPTAVVEAGYLPQLTSDLHTLDFSDFLLICREDLDEEVAFLVAWCIVKTRLAIEGQYAQLDPAHSPLSYPLRPENLRNTAVALHDGALRAYDELGDAAPLPSGIPWLKPT